MPASSNLYEINTRVWLRGFDTPQGRATLADIDPTFWDGLAQKGFDFVWLMGVWKTCPATVEKYCFEEGLVREYAKALPDWQREDVIGSPYAVDVYDVDPLVGTRQDLMKVRSDLNRRGIGLILDFVPNHFSADTSLLESHPEIFLEAGAGELGASPQTFYRPDGLKGRVFAHGRDPNFPAWQDTVQVNWFSEAARRFMTTTLMGLTAFCDGVRCDMAILPLNDIFQRTWGPVLSRAGYERPGDEFWKTVIGGVKTSCGNFIFIAEAYWDMEWQLQQLGFDYTYDKRLRDRLLANDANALREHLLADTDYQRKSVRFLENHDEERAAAAFGSGRSMAAALVAGTIQGMHLYHHGQLEGKKVRLPIQLARAPAEPMDKHVAAFYDRLFAIIREEVFRRGEWRLLDTGPAWEGDFSYPNILSWLWRHGKERRMVVVNLSDKTSTCRVRMDVKGYTDQFILEDILNDRSYLRSSGEAASRGVYVELGAYHGHVFRY